MDFHRIDKYTVQCRMTEEEMNSYGFAIEDFFTNQEKSREFLEHIVERAEEEIGYEVDGGMVSMQLMRMPDNSLTITFTDRGEESLQNMFRQVQNLASMIDENTVDNILSGIASDKNNKENGTEITQNMDEFRDKVSSSEDEKKAYERHLKEVEKQKADKNKKTASASRIYKFTSLHNLEKFAETVDFGKNISSKVYKDADSGMYYLLVKKGKLKLDEYVALCQRLSEYSDFCSQQMFVEQYCKEHFECLIPKQALRVLKEY